MKRAAGGRDPTELAEVGAEQVELGDHRVVRVVQRDQLVALVGEGGARLREVAHHLLGPVVHLARGDDLVARMIEGAERHVELMPVLGLHVLAHDGLADARAMTPASRPYRRAQRYCRFMGERDRHEAGTFSWTDLSTPDAEGSKSFWRDPLGWDFEDKPDPRGRRVRDGLGSAGALRQRCSRRANAIRPGPRT